MLTARQIIQVSLTCFCILLWLSAAAAADSDANVKVPPGSYQLTCLIVEVRGNNLRAICQGLNGDWLTTDLQNPDRCVADISNENGKLTCNRNQPGPPGTYLDAFGEGAPGFDQHVNPWASMQPANWQLEHDTWTFKDGAPENVIALAQTRDGFLWLGGAEGLFRFDGRRFELFHSLFGEELLSANISALYAPPSGGLWIGYLFGGTSFLDKGRVKNYGGQFATSSGSIRLMVQDRDGVVWAAGQSSGLWRFEESHWQHIGTDWNVPLKSALEVALDRDGDLWVGGERMLLCLHRGTRKFQVVQQNLPLNTQRIGYNGRLVDHEGSIWFSSQKGIDRFFYSPLVKPDLPRGGASFALAAEDHGVVLIGGSGAPLYRASAERTDVLPLPKYPDWMTGAIYRAPDSTIWLGESNGIWHETRSQQRRSKSSKQQDVRNALSHFTGRDWELFELPAEVADQGYFLQAITQDAAGGMWISFGRRGLYRFVDGIWTPYGGHKDLPTTGVLSEFTDSLGRVWFGYTKNQLAVLDRDRIRVLGPSDGLRVGNVTAIHGRGPKIWIGGEFGLQQFDAGHLNNINAVNNEWLRGISGIVETANGDLWLNGSSGILHMRQFELAEALKNPSYQVKGDHFGRRNGLPGFATQIRPLPSAIEASDGRIWFAVSDGVVWLDPAHAERSVPPSPITIQSILADDKTYESTLPLKFPARTSSVQISYSAVSLSEPEAIRFRYKLQETDSGWHEAATASPVTYRHLPSGSYHFSVTASDTNGDWSDRVASMEFSILPAFYQTTWFRSLCVVAFLALLAGFYQIRLRQLARQYNARLEERLGERTRIARELHDTLLQGFQGLMFRLQAVRDMLPGRPNEAMQALDTALERGDKAIAEGRDTVSDLRESIVGNKDIAEALAGLGEELGAQNDNGTVPCLRVLVEGKPRELDPLLRDEIYCVAREALRNAFRHAQAQKIEAEITYGDSEFLLHIRDDGIGLAPAVVDQGARAGHWGLPGMRERAKSSGGRLEVWSEHGAGTEVELTIPAAMAYGKSTARRSFWFWRKKIGGADAQRP